MDTSHRITTSTATSHSLYIVHVCILRSRAKEIHKGYFPSVYLSHSSFSRCSFIIFSPTSLSTLNQPSNLFFSVYVSLLNEVIRKHVKIPVSKYIRHTSLLQFCLSPKITVESRYTDEFAKPLTF